MGVLYVIDTFLHLGGAEKVLLHMLRHLPRDRFRPNLVVLRSTGPLESFSDPFPCPYEIYPLRRIYDRDAVPLAFRLRRLLLDRDIRLVHTFFENSDLWAGVVAKLSKRVVLVSSRRDLGIARTRKQSVAYRCLASLFDQVQAVSDGVRAFTIRADRMPTDRVVTVRNGLEPERFSHPPDPPGTRRRFNALEASHLVACTANIRRVKGIDVLVGAAEIVCRRFPLATFLVFGETIETDYRRRIEERLRAKGLEQRVRLTGPVEDVHAVLPSCDLFVLPSRSEGLSNALLEAMACSLPCVATRVGGNVEAISDGWNGLLAEVEDESGLAGRIVEVLSDPALARRLGDAARATVVRDFSSASMMARLTSEYDTLLRRSGLALECAG